MNPFEILDISPSASSEEIRSAYHRLAKQWHPDRFTGAEKEAAEQRFRQLAEAFSLLKDPQKREEFQRRFGGSQAAEAPRKTEAASSSVPMTERTAEDWFQDAGKALAEGQAERALGLAQYAIRMDPEKAEYHVFLAKVLQAGDGDKRLLVRSLETAIRLNPKDAESMVQLSEVFRSEGMHARAARLLEGARTLAPNHRVFVQERKRAAAAQAAAPVGLMDQFRQLLNRFQKRG